ncbi:HD domain-containing protein [Kineosporia sp. R_H_3]|uniref:HD domain-containing protein n=1 Tax=Kineosporia sp. R_H_3 TaxID=1961848 RepID=UPI000B4BF561|nr:HD domain-containing protein [Kineosporia sp. R_H_3]
METVSFTAMADGTQEDYALLKKHEDGFVAALPDRLLEALDALRSSLGGYRITRLEHSLQAATRAERDGRDEEYVVAALLHDIGDDLAPYTHGELAAAVLKPYVRPELTWVVKHHGVFQLFYYGHHVGADRNARDRFRDSPHFDACAEFCEKYDQNCFDPDYDTLPVEHFEPVLRRVVAAPRYLQEGIS